MKASIKLAFLIRLLFCSSFLASIQAAAQSLVAMQRDTSMALGSAIDITKPELALPSCFSFEKTTIGGESAAYEFEYKIEAVANQSEISRVRTRSASIGGKYSSVSFGAAVSESNNQKEAKSSLYVVIDAHVTGPRLSADNLKPKAEFVKLFSSGNPRDLIKRCGTHVLETEHRESALRIVLDLGEANSSTKTEILGAFSMKAKFIAGRMNASANYSSAVAQLVASKKINIQVQGTGELPKLEAVANLLTLNAGDFEKLAQALSAILTPVVGSTPKLKAYAFTAQPISLWSTVAKKFESNQTSLDAASELTELKTIFQDEIKEAQYLAMVIGIDETEKQKLLVRAANFKTNLSAINRDISSCLEFEAYSNASCETRLATWLSNITSQYLNSMRITVDNSKGIFLETKFQTSSQLTIVALIDGGRVPLDTFRLQKSADYKKNPIIVRGERNSIVSVAPLFAGLIYTSLTIPSNEKTTIFDVQLGCAGLLYQAPLISETSFSTSPSIFWKIDLSQLSADDPCNNNSPYSDVVPPFLGPPQIPSGFYGLRNFKWDLNIPEFRVILSNKFGLTTEHKLSIPIKELELMGKSNKTLK